MPNPPKTYDEYGRFDPDIQRNLDRSMGVTISFIENSRNQYNMGDSGNITNNNRKGAGDRVYSDFVLSYNNVAGSTPLKTLGGQYKCGLIVEAVGDMTTDASGKYVTETEATYKTRYGEDLSHIASGGKTRNQLETFITGGTSATLSGTAKSEFDCSALDNKDRIQYYYSLVNRAHKSDSDENKTMPEGVYSASNHKVFRAYAYIADYSNGTYSNVKISEVPVYFTINDIGSIAIGGPSN